MNNLIADEDGIAAVDNDNSNMSVSDAISLVQLSQENRRVASVEDEDGGVSLAAIKEQIHARERAHLFRARHAAEKYVANNGQKPASTSTTTSNKKRQLTAPRFSNKIQSAGMGGISFFVYPIGTGLIHMLLLEHGFVSRWIKLILTHG